MSDIELTIKLSEALLRRVQAAGLQIDDLPILIEEQLTEREKHSQKAIQSFAELTERIDALPDDLKPTPEEIDEEIRAVREEIEFSLR